MLKYKNSISFQFFILFLDFIMIIIMQSDIKFQSDQKLSGKFRDEKCEAIHHHLE